MLLMVLPRSATRHHCKNMQIMGFPWYLVALFDGLQVRVFSPAQSPSLHAQPTPNLLYLPRLPSSRRRSGAGYQHHTLQGPIHAHRTAIFRNIIRPLALRCDHQSVSASSVSSVFDIASAVPPPSIASWPHRSSNDLPGLCIKPILQPAQPHSTARLCTSCRTPLSSLPCLGWVSAGAVNQANA